MASRNRSRTVWGEPAITAPLLINILEGKICRELGRKARLDRCSDRIQRAVTGRVGESLIDVEAAIVEVFHMLRVVALSLLVGFRHRDTLGKGHAVRIERLAPLRHRIPVAVGHFFCRDVAEEG